MVLEARDVSKAYGATRALRGADLDVREGEVHGLVGANGAGKSTLVKVLSGATQPDAGRLRIGSWEGEELSPRRAQELGVATIYQEASLVPTLGLAENVMLGRESSRGGLFLRRRRDSEASGSMLRRVGLDPSRRILAGALKPAEQQLLEIAKALQRSARVIVMDEPTAALGPVESERLFDVIAGLRRDGVAVVYISHRLDEVLTVCDRVSVLRDGRRVWVRNSAQLDEQTLIRGMIGHDVERLALDAATRGAAVLDVRAIGQAGRLDDVSFSLHAGEIVGLTGLVGSGRSRLARILFGAERADRGEMFLDGAPYRPSSPGDAIRNGVALVPEDRKRDALLMDLTSAKNVTLARMVSRSGVLRLRQERRVATELLERLQVKPASPAAPLSALSGGNQQKVSIARWLQAEARVLILDEPGQGVDLGSKEQILRTVRELAAMGCAVLVVSQELDELQQVASRLLVMRRGTIVGELNAADITEQNVVQLAHGTGALASSSSSA
jgi:ABC-type sugar transport system ATPase subunit